jgi:hypothetical protein
MRRADKRTPVEISIQRLANLILLPDRDLCQIDHRTSLLPAPHPRCTRLDLIEGGYVQECCLPGEWAPQQPGINTTRSCTYHAARTIRARLWMQRRRLQRELDGDT